MKTRTRGAETVGKAGRWCRVLPAAGLALTLAAVLTACGDDDDPAAPPGAAKSGIATASPQVPGESEEPSAPETKASPTGGTGRPSIGAPTSQLELPADIDGVPRIPQAGNATVTRLVGRQNGQHAQWLSAVQTGIYGVNPTNEKAMQLLTLAEAGVEKTDQYVRTSSYRGLPELTTPADKGVQRCWADDMSVVCMWGDGSSFMSLMAAATPAERATVLNRFTTLRKELIR